MEQEHPQGGVPSADPMAEGTAVPQQLLEPLTGTALLASQVRGLLLRRVRDLTAKGGFILCFNGIGVPLMVCLYIYTVTARLSPRDPVTGLELASAASNQPSVLAGPPALAASLPGTTPASNLTAIQVQASGGFGILGDTQGGAQVWTATTAAQSSHAVLPLDSLQTAFYDGWSSAMSFAPDMVTTLAGDVARGANWAQVVAVIVYGLMLVLQGYAITSTPMRDELVTSVGSSTVPALIAAMIEVALSSVAYACCVFVVLYFTLLDAKVISIDNVAMVCSGFVLSTLALHAQGTATSGLISFVSFFVVFGAQVTIDVFAGPMVGFKMPLPLFFPSAMSLYAIAPALGGYSVTTPFPPAVVLLFLALQTAVYTAVSDYLYQTVHRAVTKPWNYLWAPPAVESTVLTAAEAALGVEIEGLRMEFEGEAAVDGLTLNVRRGETVALLGHNGAGKTTTLNVLTADLDATSYDTCRVGGIDIKTDADGVRRVIACATQTDMIVDPMQCARHHLELCAAIRGVSDDRIEPLLRQLNLPLDTDTAVSTFSGGMNRRLGVAMALVADSPVVLLDEPSSGLDPRSRRQLWAVLKAERSRGKTILFTTHSMEEADALGDRIAILSHGRLKYCDTSARLKNEHGIGYFLTVAQPDAPNPVRQAELDGAATAVDAPDIAVDPGFVLAMCNQFCGGEAKLDGVSATDFKIILPLDALPRFGAMLGELEEHLARLGGGRYGVAINSLEEVYVELARKEEEEEAEEAAKKKATRAAEDEAAGAAAVPTRVDVAMLDEDVRELRKNDAGADVATLFQESSTLAGWPLFKAHAAFLWGDLYGRWNSGFVWNTVHWVLQVLVVAGIFLIFAPLNGPSRSDDDDDYEGPTVQSLSHPIPVFVWDDPAKPRTAPYAPLSGQPAASSACVDELLERTASAYGHWRGVRGKPALKIRFVQSLLRDSSAISNGQWLNTENVLGFFRQTPPAYLVVRSCDTSGSAVEIRYAWAAFASTVSGIQGLDWSMRRAALAMGRVAENPVPALGASASPTSLRFDLAATVSRAPTPPPAPQQPEPTLGELAEVEFFEGVFIGVLLFVFFLGYVSAKSISSYPEAVMRQARQQGMTWQAYEVTVYLFELATSPVPVVTMALTPVARRIPHLQEGCVASVNLFLLGPLLLSTIIVTMHGAPFVYRELGLCLSTLLSYVGIVAFVGTVGLPFAVGIGMQATGECFSWWVSEFFLGSCFAWHLMSAAAIYLGSRRHSTPVEPNDAGLPDNADHDVVQEHERLMDPDSAERRGSAFAGLALRKVYPGVCCLGPAWLCPRPERNDEEDEEEMIARQNQGQDVDADAKYFEDKIALNCATLGVRRGECFGLLGPNGAGKTTLVGAISRAALPSKGEGWVNSADPTVPSDEYSRAARIGAVQQGHVMMSTLTAVENMRLALRFRLGPLYGADADWEGYIHAALAKVKLDDVDEAEDKSAHAFSGGMMRRLAVALALYTGAENVLLDEPSSAMDPYARRSLWRAIREASALCRSTLLTTHSMEEADAVCDRVAIVTKGDLRCIGTTSHLKQRFAAGYTIVVTLHQAREEAAKVLPAAGETATAEQHQGNVAVASVAQQGVPPPPQPAAGAHPMPYPHQPPYPQQPQQPQQFQQYPQQPQQHQQYPEHQQHQQPPPPHFPQQQHPQYAQHQQYPQQPPPHFPQQQHPQYAQHQQYPQQQPQYGSPLHGPGTNEHFTQYPVIASPGPGPGPKAQTPDPQLQPEAGLQGLSGVAVPYYVPEEVPEQPEGDALDVAAKRHAAFVDLQIGTAFGRSCVLKEAVGLQRRYTVTDLPSVALAFQVLAERKEQWAMENYTVSQLTTLEQVFLEFTQKSKALLA
jgi:ABC-type multidrug transport system ATPase subunit